MTALEMLEELALGGYKACWYARRIEGQPVPHVRVTCQHGLLYHVNDLPATREQAQALLEENMIASPGGH